MSLEKQVLWGAIQLPQESTYSRLPHMVGYHMAKQTSLVHQEEQPLYMLLKRIAGLQARNRPITESASQL